MRELKDYGEAHVKLAINLVCDYTVVEEPIEPENEPEEPVPEV